MYIVHILTCIVICIHKANLLYKPASVRLPIDEGQTIIYTLIVHSHTNGAMTNSFLGTVPWKLYDNRTDLSRVEPLE